MIAPKKIYRSKRKTLSIKIDGDGNLLVYAPEKLSEERIFAFINEKQGWIIKNVEKIKNAKSEFSPLKLTDGEIIPYYSGNLTVKNVCGERTKIKSGVLYVGKNDTEGFKRFIKRDFKKYICARVKYIASIMNANYISVSLKFSKTRWGSCGAANTLNFSAYMAFVPTYLTDYVIVHELAHTYHKNHGAKFWKLVEKYMPDYMERRKELKNYNGINRII